MRFVVVAVLLWLLSCIHFECVFFLFFISFVCTRTPTLRSVWNLNHSTRINEQIVAFATLMLSNFLYKSISFIFIIATRFKYFYFDILFIFISIFVLRDVTILISFITGIRVQAFIFVCLFELKTMNKFQNVFFKYI